MNIPTKISTILTVLALSLAMQAQEYHFDEMTYTPEKTTFKVFAPERAKEVLLRIYDNDEQTSEKPVKSKRMTHTGGGIWTAEERGDLKGLFYTFEITTRSRELTATDRLSARQGRQVSHGETPGVFAKAVGVNGRRGAIIDLRETDPTGWEADTRPQTASKDLIIYELHHRDFSVDPDAGFRHPGKFLALTEPQAISHLQALGVNAVHILPSFDFASIDETQTADTPARQYNWGYDPQNYNVPEGSYSTDPYDPKTRIREFKQMVQALHKAGIRVILDVVYNHTFDIGSSNFQRTYPNYFYRKTKDGTYSNGSGCGNETASEQPLMRRFMAESVRYWIQEYHIDGFRFDLMGIHDIETMNEVRRTADETAPDILIYGEGWSAGACAYPADKLAAKAHLKEMPRIAAFSDELRDALRGPFNDDTKGAFLAGIGGEEESIKAGIAGMISHPQVDYSQVNYTHKPWAVEPLQMIAYASCHDDMCLTDRLRTEMPGIDDDELIRLDLLAQTAVFTSQGIPFMLAGEEMLRSKQGVHNSYNAPDSINMIVWKQLETYPQVFDYYRQLIRLRKQHPAFRLGTADLVCKHLVFLPSKDHVVAFCLKDHAGGDRWQDIIVALNADREAAHLDIPEGQWTIVCREGVISPDDPTHGGGLGQLDGGTVTVAPQSALILHN